MCPLANNDEPRNWLWKLTAILNEPNIKADWLAPFISRVTTWLMMRFLFVLQKFRLYSSFRCLFSKGTDIEGNTFECISIKTLLKRIYTLTHARVFSGCATKSAPLSNVRGIKIKAASSVPVGRLAALRKQAFMCSGWQAFDVRSRV